MAVSREAVEKSRTAERPSPADGVFANGQVVRFGRSRLNEWFYEPESDLLEIQLRSFKLFLQEDVPPHRRKNIGLQRAFNENFPTEDPRGRFVMEFLGYTIVPPVITEEECRRRGLTYAAKLRARFRVFCTDPEHVEFEPTEEEVYLGEIPYMTSRGTFIINGVERVVVNQIQRAPGIVFETAIHPNGTRIYHALIRPAKGQPVEFSTDATGVLYIYLDRRHKVPVTTLLRTFPALEVKMSLSEEALEDGLGGSEMQEEGSDRYLLVDLLRIAEPVKVDGPESLHGYIGRRLAGRVFRRWEEEFVDSDTGEISTISRQMLVAEPGEELTEELIDRIVKAGVDEVLLQRADIDEDYSLIYNTLKQDPTTNTREALDYIHQVVRGTSSSHEARALEILERYLFSPDRCDLGEVGRYKLNKKLAELIERFGLEVPADDTYVITRQDIVGTVQYIVDMYNGKREEDDKDSLSHKYIRTVGEILYDVFNTGLARLARNVREKMNVRDSEVFTPTDVISTKSFSSVVKDFFATGELCQFADQTNPLSETSHKRRITALGEGGLTRRSAGVEVRDVHSTYYGRICPIETPEGQNIGLINNLAVHARINESGFIVTPYLKVKDGRVLFEEGVVYLTADEEEGKVIAQASVAVDENGRIIQERVRCRYNGDFLLAKPEQVDLVDISTNQILGLAASLIPFLEHDDAHRALMGSNMQRQAVPLLKPEPPIVCTGMESRVVADSGWIIRAERDGVVEYADAVKIVVRYDEDGGASFSDNVKTYYLTSFTTTKYVRTNQNTAICLKPIVRKGQRVKKGQPLCEGFATAGGELALGKNLLVAFMPWKGYNFEDAIVISERLVQEDILTSIHIFEEEETAQRLAKQDEVEKITRDLPDVPESDLRDLTPEGIVRVGARVRLGSILIGKVVPRPRTEDEPPEAKLIRALFPDKYHPYKNASLRLSSTIGRGVVIATTHYRREYRGHYLTEASIRALKETLAEYPHLSEVVEVADTVLKLYEKEVASGAKKLEKTFAEEVDRQLDSLVEKIEQAIFSKKQKRSKKSKEQDVVEQEAGVVAFVELAGVKTAQEIRKALAGKGSKNKALEEIRKELLEKVLDSALKSLKAKANKGEIGISSREVDMLRELLGDSSSREEVMVRVRERLLGESNRQLIEDLIVVFLHSDEMGVTKMQKLVREYKDELINRIINNLRSVEHERLRKILIDKLLGILEGRRVQGIYAFNKGIKEELVPAGTRVTREVLESISDFTRVDPCEWTGDPEVDGQVEELLKSYVRELRRNKVEVFYRRLREGEGIGGILDVQILERAKVYIAKKRKIKVGDKLAGRHGNKGVIAKIARIEDMPFLPDGTPVDIVLNPLGVPSRMNIGQIYEAVLGWAGQKLGVRFITPSFDGATMEDIQYWLEKAGLPPFGETVLYNGETGEPFHQKVTVGVIYMMKLIHMVEDKVHARSTGPYSMITQQPLGGRSHRGGQRLGEMEVWALEAYGAAHCLQEMLTLKSDDIEGRVRLMQYLTGSSRRRSGDENARAFPKPGIPESFKVLVNELRGLCLDPVFVKSNGETSVDRESKIRKKL